MDATSVGKLAGRRNARAGQVGCGICRLERNPPQRDTSRYGLRVRSSFHPFIIHLSLFICRVRLEVEFYRCKTSSTILSGWTDREESGPMSTIIGTGSVLQKFGDTMMIGAAPCRLRTPRGECAALHSMALSPAHEKRRDRRRGGATAARPTRPIPGSAAGESLGIRRIHHAGQDYNLPRSTRTLIAHASRAGADGG